MSDGLIWPEGQSTTEVFSPADVADEVSGNLSLFVLGGAAVDSFGLPAESAIVIGRSESADAQITERSVSREHARITRGKTLTLEDLGSRNGTFVGTTRLEAHRPVRLELDQVVRFGSVTAVVLPSADSGPGDSVLEPEAFERAFERACARARKLGRDVGVFYIHLETHISSGELHPLAVESLPRCCAVSQDAPGHFRALCTDARVAESEAAANGLASRLRDAVGSARVNVRFFPRASDGGRRSPLVVADEAMQSLYDNIRQLARGTISVLVNGETGVGKERIVEAIHEYSPRRDKPLLRLNCAAFTESLLESQLFGHEKGAFTGATGSREGLLEAASGGTVFLDEVGELTVSAQVKLLRCLEDGVVMRVGAVTPRQIDVRFVAATNRDLQREVDKGRFREDLFYRIAAATLRVPPLRARVAEIGPLARVFVERASEELGVATPELSDDALAMLQRHSWPGNIRELRNVAERAVLLCGGSTIQPGHLSVDRPRAESDRSPFEAPTLVVEERLTDEEMSQRADIIRALAEAGGNQTRAAKSLGISRVTLSRRLDRFEIPRPRKSNST